MSVKPRKPRRKIGAVIRRPWDEAARQFFAQEGFLFTFAPGDEQPKFYTIRTNKRTLTYQAKHVMKVYEATSTIRVDKRFPPL